MGDSRGFIGCCLSPDKDVRRKCGQDVRWVSLIGAAARRPPPTHGGGLYVKSFSQTGLRRATVHKKRRAWMPATDRDCHGWQERQEGLAAFKGRAGCLGAESRRRRARAKALDNLPAGGQGGAQAGAIFYGSQKGYSRNDSAPASPPRLPAAVA